VLALAWNGRHGAGLIPSGQDDESLRVVVWTRNFYQRLAER
jgi:hypothetical protein